MAKLIFGMSQSLDGFVDDAAGTLCMPPPSPAVFRHFVDVVAGHAGAIYGRRIYEVMRYWDLDQPTWGPDQREFATAWRRHPKWVASRTLTSVGPNATLITSDVATYVRDLKASLAGELDVTVSTLNAGLFNAVSKGAPYKLILDRGSEKPGSAAGAAATSISETKMEAPAKRTVFAIIVWGPCCDFSKLFLEQPRLRRRLDGRDVVGFHPTR